MILINRIFRKIITRFFPSKHQKIVNQYFNDGGETRLRYNYLLNEKSIVFDLGGYEGQWASDIFARYQSFIYIFEPVNNFYLNILERFHLNNKITVYNYGVGASNREELINISKDGSSIYLKGKDSEKIKIINFLVFLSQNQITQIDLIKINIEGGEYEILEELIKSGYILNIKNLQIQFHDIFSESKERMLNIQKNLAKSHKLTYQYLFVWENWEKIND